MELKKQAKIGGKIIHKYLAINKLYFDKYFIF